MHQLSGSFLQALKSGFLSPLLNRVIKDIDLDLEIRENYLNIYYKGNSLLKLHEANQARYQITIDPKFLGGLQIYDLVDDKTVCDFLSVIPDLKEKIQIHKSSVETEYEQLVIRANNYEPRNNSEYYIIDRQYNAGPAGRFDLIGLFWPRSGRQRNRIVDLCLIEIKYALNPDIQDLHKQLARYYQAIQGDPEHFVQVAETIFKQKLELGLFKGPENRLEAMRNLVFSRDYKKFQFIVLLIDYNPHSSHFDSSKLAALPFANQVKIFRTGFALWKTNLVSPGDLIREH